MELQSKLLHKPLVELVEDRYVMKQTTTSLKILFTVSLSHFLVSRPYAQHVT